jgi:hypothetical protein
MTRAAWIELGILLAASTVIEAQDERIRSEPTGWYWYYGQSIEDLANITASTGARFVDLEIESASPLRFSAALVVNQGAYAKASWYFIGLTGDQLGATLANLNARILDLEPYDDNGTTRFAVVMVPNTGADAKAWWYYYNTDVRTIGDASKSNNARLVDLDRYEIGGNVFYSAVMISNQGADRMDWDWVIGLDANAVVARAQSESARVMNLESYIVNGAWRYDAILVKRDENPWWFYAGLTETQLGDAMAQNGARLSYVMSYWVSGVRFFDVLMVNNANAITTRIGKILDHGADGETGLYLKEVGGPVLAALQENRVFEPASTIKALIHLHALRAVQGGMPADTPLPWCPTSNNATSPKDGCPNPPCGSETIGLQTALQQMMWISDNRATDAVVRRFGMDSINDTGASIGMSSSKLNHRVGCGGPIANQLTRADLGRVYEAVATGALDEEHRELFYSWMVNGVSTGLAAVITEEGTALGMSSAQIAEFISRVKVAGKAGWYTLWSTSRQTWEYYTSQGLWASLPFCASNVEVHREYVFGLFVVKGIDSQSVAARSGTAASELLREQIRSAMSSFATPCEPPPPPAARFVRADANLDGKLDLSDGVFILGFLFTGGQKLRCDDAADVNDDGRVDISDASALLNFLFRGGKLPKGTAVGKPQEDTTPDKLDCDFYPKI